MPAQRRSAERVSRMLDACADIVDETGYEGLSTTLVAQRAGVAIGSVYQFFPGKRAIAQALVLRNLELFGDRVAGRLADKPLEHWSDVVGVVFEVYVDMHRTVPGFRALRFGDVAAGARPAGAGPSGAKPSGAKPSGVRPSGAGPSGGEPGDAAVIADRLRALLVEAAGLDDTAELARILAVAVEAGDAVLKLAFRRHPDGDERVLAEAERLVRSYLAGRLE